MPKQQTSSLTAKSRRFNEVRDGTGKLPTPDSHVDNEYGTKTMVYNREMNEKKREEEKQREKGRLKKYNNRKKGRTLNH